jgi:hypothetical protein
MGGERFWFLVWVCDVRTVSHYGEGECERCACAWRSGVGRVVIL